ncbi:MAG: serine/threonine protein kinase [Proteobacteria bacterium]|nr:serine/threonine protein kinase [Pseudomonadota bacterium]
MEYVPGRTLAAAIGAAGLPIDTALDYAIQVSSALAAAHTAGIVHRDLKPANIIISDTGVAKVLDFGLAKLVEQTGSDESTRTALTEAGTVLGTAAYMSPEQAAGQPVDGRTDQFSLGSVFYEALSGTRAFPGDSTPSVLAAVLRDHPKPLRTLRPDVPSALARILDRCLQKEPASRYAATQALHDDLVSCRERLLRPGAFSSVRRPRLAIPLLLLLLAIAAAVSWFAIRASRTRWAVNMALPEAAKLIDAEKPIEAFELLRQARQRIPDDPRLKELLESCSVTAKLELDPQGARVSWKPYGAPDSPWQPLLQGDLVPRAYLRFQISGEGYETQELAGYVSAPLAITLYHRPTATGMVYIPAGIFPIRPGQNVRLGDYWLDRYEVTNREYKAFLDQGGYNERKHWTQPFMDGGKQLSWEEATARFRDTTGRPGPATWELGTYPEGQADYPVTGVSWYEAAAYAAYAGKSLPTIFHWRRACPEVDFAIAGLSNFGGKGPEKVGSRPGLAPWGNYDMAGNVKEWCWTNVGGLRYLMGGAWNEPLYSFTDPDAQSPFARLPGAGFRCAKYASPVADSLLGEFRWLERDYAKEKPAGDELCRAYENLYAYERTELAPVVEATDESSPSWVRQRVSFNAAYGRERMVAQLFLPRNTKPPWQTVLYFPGSSAFMQRSRSDAIRGSAFDFIARSGRAVAYPVYRGTYERGMPMASRPAANSVTWRDLLIACYKDLGRSLDYLETRPDVDSSRIGHVGLSSGALWAPIFLAIEGRFRAAVLVSGGLAYEEYRPEVDPLNFAPRVKIPILMLNGRYDFAFPLQCCQLPLLRLLGTPDADKRHVLFDCAHAVPRNGMIMESLNWLDKYLGPVK